MRLYLSFVLLLGWTLFISHCNAADLSLQGIADFHDKSLHEPFDLSGIARVGNYIVVSSDEGHVIQVLERENTNTFVLKRKYTIPDGEETDRQEKEDPELDIEGITADGKTVYIIGSHSRKRGKVEVRNLKRRSHDKNRERLAKDTEEAARRILLRLKLDENGHLDGEIEQKNLWDAILKFSELAPFTKIPSKENGIDIEGIAVKDKKLYIGFRAPVLRENWVPVMVTQFDDPVESAELRFINLGGLGIRDMVAVDDQFFLIAGPVGDGPGGYHLYSWNGLDCIPGKNGAKGKAMNLGKIPTESNAKAEGLAVLSNTEDGFLQLLVVFDGPERGAPLLLFLRR